MPRYVLPVVVDSPGLCSELDAEWERLFALLDADEPDQDSTQTEPDVTCPAAPIQDSEVAVLKRERQDARLYDLSVPIGPFDLWKGRLTYAEWNRELEFRMRETARLRKLEAGRLSKADEEPMRNHLVTEPMVAEIERRIAALEKAAMASRWIGLTEFQ